MNCDRNRAYFQRRAAEEQSAADRSSDERVRGSHLELARRYRELATSAPRPMRIEVGLPAGVLTPEFRILN